MTTCSRSIQREAACVSWYVLLAQRPMTSNGMCTKQRRRKMRTALTAVCMSCTLQKALFFCTVVCAVSMAVGFYTRISSFLVFILTVSLHNRNIHIVNGGDAYLRIILMWGNLIPWGEVRTAYNCADDRAFDPLCMSTYACRAMFVSSRRL